MSAQPNMIHRFMNSIKRIGRSEAGNVLIITGLIFPIVLFGVVVAGVDFGRVYYAKSSLAQAVTSSAIAGGKFARMSDPKDTAKLQGMIRSIYYANISEKQNIGADVQLVGSPVIDFVSEGEAITAVRVTGSLQMQYLFLKYFGLTTADFSDSATVRVAADNLDVSFMADNFPGTFPDYNNKGYQLSSIEYVVDQLAAGDPKNLRIGVVPSFVLTPKAFGDDKYFYPSLALQVDPLSVVPSGNITASELREFRSWLKRNYSWEPLMYWGRFLFASAGGGSEGGTVLSGYGLNAQDVPAFPHPSQVMQHGGGTGGFDASYGKYTGAENSLMWVLPRHDMSDKAIVLCALSGLARPGYCDKPDYIGFGVYTNTTRSHGVAELTRSTSFFCDAAGAVVGSIEDLVKIYATGSAEGINASQAALALPCSFALAAPQEIQTLRAITGNGSNNDNWPRVYVPMAPMMLLATGQLAMAGNSAPAEWTGDVGDDIGSLIRSVFNSLGGLTRAAVGFLPNIPLGDTGLGLDVGGALGSFVDSQTGGSQRKVLVMIPNYGMGYEVLGYHTSGKDNPAGGNTYPALWYNNRTEDMTKAFSYLGGKEYLNNPAKVCGDIRQAGIEIYGIQKKDPYVAKDIAQWAAVSAFTGGNLDMLAEGASRWIKTRFGVLASMMACVNGPGHFYNSPSAKRFTYFSKGGGGGPVVPALASIISALPGTKDQPTDNMADTVHRDNLRRIISNMMTVTLVER